MAETSIPIQPAAAPGTPPAPQQLKMFTVPDALGGQTGAAPQMVSVQAMCLVDDQGRAYVPMTEVTGRKLVRLLDQLCRMQSDRNGVLYSPDNAGPDADST